MSGKRQRLDGDGRSIRQLELELELARLRREEEEETNTTAAGDEIEELPPPPPPSTSTPATANNIRQSTQQTPAASSQHPAGSSQQGQERGGRGGGRGGRAGLIGQGGRGRRFQRGGLLTVFVCIAHDDLFCQVCNAYKSSTDYWKRHWVHTPIFPLFTSSIVSWSLYLNVGHMKTFIASAVTPMNQVYYSGNVNEHARRSLSSIYSTILYQIMYISMQSNEPCLNNRN